MKKYMMLFAICALVLFVSVDVLAQGGGGDPFQIAIKKALEAFKGTRALIFTVGGFALVGLGCAAIFGKINWKWVGALAIGLGILAVAGYIVEFAYSDKGVADNPGFPTNYWQ